MTEKEIAKHLECAVGDADLSDTEIPSIDLYLDQILCIFAEKNAQSTKRYRERALTKTMINNYSKSGLISPINGKKYSRAQIVEMLLVYTLKNSLSMDEIKRLLTGVREDCDFTGEDLTAAYHRFLSVKNANRSRATEAVHGLLKNDQLDAEDDKDFFLLILDILSLSSYLKTMAQELLEARYEDPEARERERKEKDEAEKRERKEKDEAQKRERKEKDEAQKRERKERDEAQKRERKNRDAEVKATIKKLKEELASPPGTEED